ncbi:MAG: hypothetical protein H6824_16065 [Planctomycetaceae bacterium]|nr:hypothetical protein [Planctomycetaceae bacterium]
MRIATTGLVMIVLGIAIFVFTLIRLIGGEALEPQTKVPGTITADIDLPGRYYVWDNHWTNFEGERVKYPADWPNEATVTVRDADGTELAFVPDASHSWSIGNNAKTSVGFIDVPSATTIRVDIDSVGRERIVTVSSRTMKQELWSRLGGFAVGIIVGLAGVLIGVFGLLVRRQPSTAADQPNPASNV